MVFLSAWNQVAPKGNHPFGRMRADTRRYLNLTKSIQSRRLGHMSALLTVDCGNIESSDSETSDVSITELDAIFAKPT